MIQSQILVLLVLGALLPLLAGFLYLSIRVPAVALAVVLVVAVLAGTRDIAYVPAVKMGDIGLIATDFFTLAFVLIALVRIPGADVPRVSKAGIVTLSVLVSIGFLTWLMESGLLESVYRWRSWILSVAVFGWALVSVDFRQAAHARAVVIVGMLAGLLQVAALSSTGLSQIADYVNVDGLSVSSRPLSAAVAFILLAALLLVGTATSSRPLRIVAWAILGASIAVSQQRTVWMCCLAVCVVWIFQRNRLGGGPRWIRVSLGALTAASSVIVFVFLGLSRLLQSTSDASTLFWRAEQWNDRLTIPRALSEWLFGAAFGPTDVTTDPGFQIQAHDMYVEAVGVLGVVGLVALLAIALRPLARVDRLASSVAPLLITAVIVYGLTYSWPPWSFALLGGCTIAVKKAQGTSQESASFQRSEVVS